MYYEFIYNNKRNLFIGYDIGFTDDSLDVKCFNKNGIISQHLKCNDIHNHQKMFNQFGYEALCNDDYFIRLRVKSNPL